MVKLVIKARNCGYGDLSNCEKRFREALEGRLGQAVALYRVRDLLYCFLVEFNLIDSFVKWLDGKRLLEEVYKITRADELALEHYRKASKRKRKGRKKS